MWGTVRSGKISRGLDAKSEKVQCHGDKKDPRIASVDAYGVCH